MNSYFIYCQISRIREIRNYAKYSKESRVNNNYQFKDSGRGGVCFPRVYVERTSLEHKMHENRL